MKKYLLLLFFFNLIAKLIFCQDSTGQVFKSKNLIINKLAENSYQHISYLQTDDFGLVPCNGLIVRDKNEALIFDSPTNNETAEELIRWIEVELGCKIKGIIPTHFHDDCLGGLNAFHKYNIPSYGFYKTIELTKEKGITSPKNSFKNILKLKIGNESVVVRFFGEGHTKDNVVGYFSKDQILFGGCLIKELNATKGNLEDANLLSWSDTVEKVKRTFPKIKIIVPGHGQAGDSLLLDYTITLFK